MTNQEPETHKKTDGSKAEAVVKAGRRKGETGVAVASGVLGRDEAGKRKKVGSAKARKKRRKKGSEVSPVEEVTMTAEEEKELKRWLASKVRDPNFKRLSASKLNHEILKLMVTVPSVLKMSQAVVEKYTDVSRQHQRKLLPRVIPQQDVQVALTTWLRWCNGLRLHPISVLEWILKRPPFVLTGLQALEA